MKRIILPICICVVLSVMSACKKGGFLDATVTTQLDESTVFVDSARTANFLGNVYRQVGFSFNPQQFGNAGLEAASDEAKGYSTGASDAFLQFQYGVVNSANITDNPWNTCYKNLRALNIFLKNIGKTPMRALIKQHSIGEAHFLRAWYYSILLKHYGGVPLIGDTIYNASDNINVPRNSYDACVKYIVAECDEGIKFMGVVSDNSPFYGKATPGACLALKSRVLLYAASPLFNGQNIGTGDSETRALTGYPDYNVDRWRLARDAAEAVIKNGNGGVAYTLYKEAKSDSLSQLPGHSFKALFTVGSGGAGDNKESIFLQLFGQSTLFEQLWNPPSRGGGRHAWPYQETAEAFGMINGKPINDPESGYDKNYPYKNRDPRFGFSILHNDLLVFKTLSIFLHIYEPLQTYVGAKTGDGFGAGTPTGYYIGKLVDDRADGNYNLQTNHDYHLIRYAEILLNYCEAANEVNSPEPLIYTYLKQIRTRAGIQAGADKNYGLKLGMSQAELRQVIRNERQVELAFESHRFWDVRRWKIAEETDNRKMHGVKITKQAANVFTYQRVDIEQRSFRPQMYFWPIPQSETQKSPLIKQNPGYDR